jgi:Immunity protein 10
MLGHMLGRQKELRFIGTAVTYRQDREVEAEYLVVAEGPDGRGRTVEVQRSLSQDTDDDRSLGVDGHCVVIDGGPTSYRCVERWAVAQSIVVIRLTNEGGDELGVTSIRIEVPEDAAAATASALQRLIDDGPEVEDFSVVKGAYCRPRAASFCAARPAGGERPVRAI